MTMKKLFLTLSFAFLISSAASGQRAEDPDPLRFEEEINAFVDWDLKNSIPEQAILFVGSSSIRLWKTAIAFHNYPVINRGFGGSHTSDVLYYYESLIPKYTPDLIIYYEGDNDIASDKPVEQVFDDYKKLITRILDDLPETRFLYIPAKPSTSRWNYWEKMSELNQLIEKYNNEHDRLFYTDLATPLLGSDGRPDDSYFLDDQLHLNNRGYQIWNQHLRPELKQLMDR